MAEINLFRPDLGLLEASPERLSRSEGDPHPLTTLGRLIYFPVVPGITSEGGFAFMDSCFFSSSFRIVIIVEEIISQFSSDLIT